MRRLEVALVQWPAGLGEAESLALAESQVEAAAEQGAELILLPELFALPYFPVSEAEAHFGLARTLEDSAEVQRLQPLARRLGVALPISFFEREGPHYYNSVAFVDERGELQGVYRKAHIPDGPGYEEKFFFRPGNTPFRVFETRRVRVGLGICWDQWFPEVARCLALQGAELLLYPTAIGSEPQDPSLDTRGPWQRVMQGHAVANACPVLAANRLGAEGTAHFYGHSFIADHTGALVAQAEAAAPQRLHHTFDFDAIAEHRAAFGFFRDRRPDLYTPLTAL